MSDSDSHPQPQLRPSERIALCLSGGGYRAALFHLGALRRLDELGILSKVDTIASVSGGSIMSAQIAGQLVADPQAWDPPGGRVAGFDEGIAGPMIALAQRDIRTHAVLGRFWPPSNLLKQNPQMDVLTKELAVGPVGAPLVRLPDRPRFVFCSTDVVYRVLWTFDTGTRTMGDAKAGHAPLGDWTIAHAAAASSCVPLLFKAVRIDAPLTGGAPDCDRGENGGSIDIVDGGIYDDLGIDAVRDDHSTILVSDAGPVYRPRPRKLPLWRGLRSAITMFEQASEVRARWFRERLEQGEVAGAYWGVKSVAADYPVKPTEAPYPDELIRCWIEPVRNDLNAFTKGERAVLQNHGYLMADLAIHASAAGLIADDAPPKVPYPKYMEEATVKDTLRHSDESKLL